MRCAKCKADGPSVTIEQIKLCFKGEPDAHPNPQVPLPPLDNNEVNAWAKPDAAQVRMDDIAAARGGPMWPPSEKQVSYVLVLQDERQLPDGYTVKSEAIIKGMERDAVSADITFLKTLPRKVGGEAINRQWSMPEGRYALHWGESGPTGWTGWHFYEVDKPSEGRWVGYTFIKRLIGAPGTYQKVDIKRSDRDEVLRAIEEDPKRAMVDYGKQARVCGRCASPLSNDDKPHPHDGLTSIQRGIGPVCMFKDGWF